MVNATRTGPGRDEGAGAGRRTAGRERRAERGAGCPHPDGDHAGRGRGGSGDAVDQGPGRAGRVPVHSVAGAALRRTLWRGVLSLTGGIDVEGRLPRGGCVVVANHASHADTVALLAALDARHAPRVAAARDYWFASAGRAALCRWLAAGFPVRRTGGGSADLAAAAGQLAAGRAVAVFPEGTRGGDGEGVQPFRSGALLLAAGAGVPVVPVGLSGTSMLLPKHGRLRAAVVRVRIGEPLTGAGPEQVRRAVALLADA